MARSPFKMTAGGIPVGRYPYKVKGFMPGSAGRVQTEDTRKHKPGTLGMRKAKRK